MKHMLIQFAFVLVLFAALFVTWRRAKQNVISRIEAFGWSVVWIAAIAVVLLPQTTTVVANFFGVGRGVDFIIYASVITLFFLVFKLFVAIDGFERKLTDLVRKDALKDLPPHQDSPDRDHPNEI